MKTRMKKLTALFLSAAMVTGMFVGCGAKEETKTEVSSTTEGSKTYNGVDVSEHVDLKMYLLGDRAADFDEVYAEVNKILEEKLNCSVSVDFLSWGEHEKKYSLLFSSQEDFDLIFTASSWGHYEQTVSLGGFYPMSEEFLQTYAPQLMEYVPEVAWNQAKIEGQIYMVPNKQTEYSQDIIAIRGDLMEEFGMERVGTWEELVTFYQKCAEKGIYASQGGPWYQYFQGKGMTLVGGAPKSGELALYNHSDVNDTTIYSTVDWDGFTDYCKQVKEMADMGCWSPDVMNNTEDRQTGLLTGKTAGMIWNMGSCYNYAKQANQENPDFKVTLQDPLTTTPKMVNSYINNGVAINNMSKNPERAMMVINELYTNPELQDLTMLGIEGKHWEAVGEKEFTLLDQSGYAMDNNCNWGWKNEDLFRTEYIAERTSLDNAYEDMKAAFGANLAETHPLEGFNFNTSNVTSQVAAVEAAVDTYYTPLVNGLVEDVEASIEALKSAMESAGMAMIMEEMQKQADEYVASK